MMKYKANCSNMRFVVRILAICLAVCLVASMALEAPAAAAEVLPFYTITVGTFTGGKIAVSSTDERSRRSFDYLNPGDTLKLKPGSKLDVWLEPDSTHFAAGAYYTMNDDLFEFTVRRRDRLQTTIQQANGDITLEVYFVEKYSISVPEYEHGQVSFTQDGKTYELKSGQTIPPVIDPMMGLELLFQADPGYKVGSKTYCLDEDTEILLGFTGKNKEEKITIREGTGFIGNITVFPEFAAIVGEGQYGITAEPFDHALIEISQVVNGELETTELESDDTYAIDADTEVTITITPALNYIIRPTSYYTVNGLRQRFHTNNSAGGIVTQTIKVVGDVRIHLDLLPTRRTGPYVREYPVEQESGREGFVIRDHISAYAGETVRFTIKTSSGWEVDQATVVRTMDNRQIRVKYEGINLRNNGHVYSFRMPLGTVKIIVTYKRTQSQN